MSEVQATLTGSNLLPMSKRKATRISPKILVLYSLPKVGKTKALTELDNCMILDTEDGTGMYDCISLAVHSVPELKKFLQAVEKEGAARAAKGVTGDALYPYKYIAIDTIDAMEDLAETEATRKYKASSMAGKEFKESGTSVLELAHGLGYYYLREELLEIIKQVSMYCRHLILTVHVKEKLLDKKGEQVKSNDISLTGKLGSMVCAKADAIGYLYRQKNKETNEDVLMVSFETGENQVMGARQPYLAGQKFPFSWDKIYVD